MYGGTDYILGLAGNNIYDLGDGNDRAGVTGGNDTLIGGSDTSVDWLTGGWNSTNADRLDYRHEYRLHSCKNNTSKCSYRYK